MATSPVQWNMVVRKNAPWDQELTITDTEGVAVDITGWTFAMQVRLYEGAGGAALIDLATVVTAIEGIQITDAAAGEIVIRIDEASLEALPAQDGENKPATFRHDIEVDDGTDEFIAAYGTFTVYTGVTR